MIEAIWRAEFKSLYKGIDAQKVAEEIMAIGEEVSPEEVVEEARNPNTELHLCFEWDDSIAAESWRKQQARKLFSNLIIKMPENNKDDEQKEPVRYFYNNDGKTYKTTTYIFSKPDEYQKLLQRAMAELQAFQKKYASLTELDEIMELISKLAA